MCEARRKKTYLSPAPATWQCFLPALSSEQSPCGIIVKKPQKPRTYRRAHSGCYRFNFRPAPPTTTEHGTITALDSQTTDGHFVIQRAAAEGPKHMTMQISGKWLDATCSGKDGDE